MTTLFPFNRSQAFYNPCSLIMKEMDTNLDAEIRTWQEKLFNASIRRKRKLQRITELVGNTAGLHCLEISSGDGCISAQLRSLGGRWKTAAATEEEAASLRCFIPEKITVLQDGRLPFEKSEFDAVIIVDALRGIAADRDFIQECHRVLKDGGSVIISEESRPPINCTALLRRLLGVSPVARGLPRNGYSNSELYNILKDGFDVPAADRYSNGLLETVCAIGEAVQQLVLPAPYWLIRSQAGQETLYRYRRLYTLLRTARPLLWLAAQCEFLPSHRLVIKSRRRPWRPRLQPRLVDGRSIAEAAINTKIGTAAPF